MIKNGCIQIFLLGFFSLLSACSVFSQQGYEAHTPPLPIWAIDSERWDSTGLTISAYASLPYNFSAYASSEDPSLAGELHNEMDLAEEAAFRRARELISEELNQIWLDYVTLELAQKPAPEQIKSKIRQYLRGVFVNKRFYDEQRRIFHIQVYLSSSRISAIFESAFGLKVVLEDKGKLVSELNPIP
jgi:hypothetical protein